MRIDFVGVDLVRIDLVGAPLVQHHGVSKLEYPRVSNINYTISTPKGVTVAPFF